MQYVAIDLLKRFSALSALNEQGQRTREARIDGNSAARFVQFFQGLEEPGKVVIEATHLGWLNTKKRPILNATFNT